MTDIMTLHEPPSWRLYRLGQLFDERKEKVSDKDYPPLSVTMNGIVPQLETAAKSDDGDNRKLVKVGDYVINSRSDRKGSGGISSHDGSVSLISIVLKPKGVHSRFAHHLLRSRAFQEEFYRWGHGIVADLWTTRYADMKNIRLFVPDLNTQKAIADFLDRETARIDHLIEKKQELQSLIQFKSQALLEKYFTFGLVADRQRKATGLPWLPTIPVSWGITAIKRVVKVKDGTHETPSYVDADEKSFPLITSKDFIGDSIDFINAKSISAEDHDLIYRRSDTEQGDVLMSMIGGNIGKSIIVMDERKFSIKNVALFKTGGKQQLAKQILLFLRSPLFNEQLRLIGRGGAQDFIGLGDIRNLMFPIIPEDELKELIIEANSKIRDLTKVVEYIQFSISRLHELRAALITSAVTGQIDVKNWGKQGQPDRLLDQIEEDMALREARA